MSLGLILLARVPLPRDFLKQSGHIYIRAQLPREESYKGSAGLDPRESRGADENVAKEALQEHPQGHGGLLERPSADWEGTLWDAEWEVDVLQLFLEVTIFEAKRSGLREGLRDVDG